jgi:hypothetical protein
LQVPQSFRPLLDCGLLETIGRTLLAVLHLPPEPSDLCGVSEQDLTVGDLSVFLVTIVGHAISLPGSQNMQVCVCCEFICQSSRTANEELSCS